MRKATILLVLALVFFCVLGVMGPMNLRELKTNHNVGSTLLVTFGVIGGFLVLCFLLTAGLDATEEPARHERETNAEEERIKAIEKENAALRQWAKSGKMPVKISPKGDSKEQKGTYDG